MFFNVITVQSRRQRCQLQTCKCSMAAHFECVNKPGYYLDYRHIKIGQRVLLQIPNQIQME